MSLDLNRPIGILVKTTCVDFPGILATSFFLQGCNLRCPYCYNVNLVINNHKKEDFSTVQELFNHLEKRQGVLSGLAISGGEPLLNPYTPIIIKKARSLGYKIKIDTNASLPFELNAFLQSQELCPDFLAIDIKTSPKNYAHNICNKTSVYFNNEEYWQKTISQSCKLASSLPPNKREFRTVLVPPLITKNDIKNIAQLLPQDASWKFAQFQNKNCLDPSYNKIIPYTDKEVQELVDYARTLIKDVELR